MPWSKFLIFLGKVNTITIKRKKKYNLDAQKAKYMHLDLNKYPIYAWDIPLILTPISLLPCIYQWKTHSIFLEVLISSQALILPQNGRPKNV